MKTNQRSYIIMSNKVCKISVSKNDRLCGQISWLQVQRSGFDSRRYQIFWEVLSLERNPLDLVSTNEELLARKSSSSGLEIREYGRRDPSRWPRGTLYPQKLALTAPTSGCRSVGIVLLRTLVAEFSFSLGDSALLQAPNLTHNNRNVDYYKF
jgi:hypothetical protein